jgi:hypothetical protein
MTVAGRFMFALFRADPQERPSSNAIRPLRAYGGLNGNDLRRDALAVRKATLASLVARAAPELRLSEYLDHDDGALVFKPACRLGLEGVVSKRRSRDWVKSKNPNAPAVKREAEEDWGKWSSAGGGHLRRRPWDIFAAVARDPGWRSLPISTRPRYCLPRSPERSSPSGWSFPHTHEGTAPAVRHAGAVCVTLHPKPLCHPIRNLIEVSSSGRALQHPGLLR